MSEAIINNMLKLQYPEDFHVLDQEQLNELYMEAANNHWAARNDDKHILLTVLWMKTNRILAALADMKAVARKNEQMMRSGLSNNEYKCSGFISEEVCGQKAEGYCYEYVNMGYSQHVKTLLIKAGSCIYSLSCYTRGPMSDEADALFREMLGSVERI